MSRVSNTLVVIRGQRRATSLPTTIRVPMLSLIMTLKCVASSERTRCAILGGVRGQGGRISHRQKKSDDVHMSI
jgi:hypothetical protein